MEDKKDYTITSKQIEFLYSLKLHLMENDIFPPDYKFLLRSLVNGCKQEYLAGINEMLDMINDILNTGKYSHDQKIKLRIMRCHIQKGYSPFTNFKQNYKPKTV